MKKFFKFTISFLISASVLALFCVASFAQDGASVRLIWNGSINEPGGWVGYGFQDLHVLRSASQAETGSVVELNFSDSERWPPFNGISSEGEATIKEKLDNPPADDMRNSDSIRVKLDSKDQAAKFVGLLSGPHPAEVRIVAADMIIKTPSICNLGYGVGEKPSDYHDLCVYNQITTPSSKNIEVKLPDSERFVPLAQALDERARQNSRKQNVADAKTDKSVDADRLNKVAAPTVGTVGQMTTQVLNALAVAGQI